MPAWIARRAAPAVWKRIPWKMVWTVVVWLGNKGRERVDDNLTQKEQSEFWNLLKKSKGRPATSPSATARGSRASPARRSAAADACAPTGYRPGAPTSPQRPRPDPGLRGLDRGAGAAQLDRPGAAGRAARLPPLLGRRAPRRRARRRALAGGADRPDRRRDQPHAGRQRRRDAAPLQPAQGGGELRRPRRPLPGPHRPRDRPRRRHRPDDHPRAPARPLPRAARRLPGAAGRAARLLRAQLPGRPSVARLAETLPGEPGGRRSRGCSAPPSRARSGPANSACATPSPTSSTRAGRPIAETYRRELRRRRAARRAAPRGRGAGDRRRDRGGGASGSRPAGAWPSTCCAAAA